MLRPRLPTLRRLRSAVTDTSTTKPFYITTPIFYPNAVPHIGHLYSLVIADILARFTRISEPNRRVHFLTGTDEHGLKIQKAAKDRGIEPSLLCDALSEQFRRLGAGANISNTVFLRTTEARHREAVEHVWVCTSHRISSTRAHIPPSSPTPISIETSSAVEWSSESNYKFRLSCFREPLLDYYNSKMNLLRTLSSCLQANSSSWFTSTGSLSMTGRDIVLTDDSISAPYLTTRELALPCSYARKAVLNIGKLDTLTTKSGEVKSAGEEGDEAYSALDDADDCVRIWARMRVKIIGDA